MKCRCKAWTKCMQSYFESAPLLCQFGIPFLSFAICFQLLIRWSKLLAQHKWTRVTSHITSNHANVTFLLHVTVLLGLHTHTHTQTHIHYLLCCWQSSNKDNIICFMEAITKKKLSDLLEEHDIAALFILSKRKGRQTRHFSNIVSEEWKRKWIYMLKRIAG